MTSARPDGTLELTLSAAGLGATCAGNWSIPDFEAQGGIELTLGTDG